MGTFVDTQNLNIGRSSDLFVKFTASQLLLSAALQRQVGRSFRIQVDDEGNAFRIAKHPQANHSLAAGSKAHAVRGGGKIVKFLSSHGWSMNERHTATLEAGWYVIRKS